MTSSSYHSHTPLTKPILLGNRSLDRRFTYPHCNGFMNHGRTLVLAQHEQKGIRFVAYHLPQNPPNHDAGLDRPSPNVNTQLLMEWSSTYLIDAERLYYDIAAETNQMLLAYNNRLWLWNPCMEQKPICFFTAEEKMNVASIGSIDPTGRWVYIRYWDEHRNQLIKIDTQDGSYQVIVEHSWELGHVQLSPYNAQYIGYCHEGETSTIPDRVWAWHAQHFPDGACVFNQYSVSDTPGTFLYVGHERWCFHDCSLIVVAYGECVSGLRGLYQVFLDHRSPRLLSPGNRDWHCDAAQDGAWFVVDTTGPYDSLGKGWEHANSISDILLIHGDTGKRFWLARSHIGSAHKHPHPVFSPDGNWIIYNDVSTESNTPKSHVYMIPLGSVKRYIASYI